MKEEFIENKYARRCKKKCRPYKALKPATGGRYDIGQVRCRVCKIYLTEEGVDNHVCKCCKCRVRRCPRGKEYKRRYLEKIEKAKNVKLGIDGTM